MQTFKYTVKDELGIHARPAGLFVKEASAFPCKITVAKDGREADAKDIMSVMGLGVKYGQEITVTAVGEQEETAIGAIRAFLEEHL